MIDEVPKNSWPECCEILKHYSKDNNKKWGLRFYLYLTELIRYFNDIKNEPGSVYDKITKKMLKDCLH